MFAELQGADPKRSMVNMGKKRVMSSGTMDWYLIRRMRKGKRSALGRRMRSTIWRTEYHRGRKDERETETGQSDEEWGKMGYNGSWIEKMSYWIEKRMYRSSWLRNSIRRKWVAIQARKRNQFPIANLEKSAESEWMLAFFHGQSAATTAARLSADNSTNSPHYASKDHGVPIERAMADFPSALGQADIERQT